MCVVLPRKRVQFNPILKHLSRRREECKEKCVILDAQNHHRNLRRGRRKGMMKKVSFAMKKKQTERRACFVQRQFTYHHTTQLANACCSLEANIRSEHCHRQ